MRINKIKEFKRALRSDRNKFMVCFTYQSIIDNLINIGSLFMTSFVLFLGFEDAQIGLLASLVSLTGIFQIFSSYIYIKVKSRKKVIIALTLIKYILLSLVIFIPLIVKNKVIIVVSIITFLAHSIGSLQGAGMLEWNNKFVPDKIKGRYFSTRNLIGNVIAMILSIMLGKYLDKYDGVYGAYVFIIIIVLVLVLFCIKDIIKLKSCDDDLIDKPIISMKKVIFSPLSDKRYMKYIKFNLLWMFAWSFGRPYYNIYTIKYVGLDYSYIALIASVTAMVKICSARIWGMAVDKKGSEKLILITGTLFGFSNFLWVFITQDSYFLYPILIIINGLMVIGVNISKFNLNLSLTSKDERLAYLAFNGAVVAIFSFISTNISTILIKILLTIDIVIWGMNINTYQFIFCCSGFLHIIAVLYLLKNVRHD